MEAIIQKPLNSIWLKASVAGSIWASIEILLGSFLHNMKIPMSGMILSFISVWLMISFIHIWRETGIIWRAGLVCALMKSISPSAFIFGPMIGIFTESLIVYFFVLILGKNLIGYSAAGALAVLSSLIQKVVSLLILYGFDFIKILTDLYHYALKQVNITDLSPAWLLIVITCIYSITGITAAVAGYLTGRRYMLHGGTGGKNAEIVLKSGSQLFNNDYSRNFSVYYLLVHFAAITGILLLINSDMLLPASGLSAAYFGFSIYNYKSSLKRLKKVSFWLSFILITFAASFLWSGFREGALFSLNGLFAGLKMNAHAIVMMIGFASVSVELRNPVIRSLLYHRGLSNLYQAMNLSFSALPFLISSTPGDADRKKVSGRFMLKLFSQAGNLLEIFEKYHLTRPDIVIVTGEIQQGKTTFVQKIVTELKDMKIATAGFLSIGIDDRGRRTGFRLQDIGSGDSVYLCSDKNEGQCIQYGRYYFRKDALLLGNDILSLKNIADKQLIIIDEIGPLELNGQGWSPAIDNSTRHYAIPQLWVVRKSLLNKVTKQWNTGNIFICDIADSSIAEVVGKLSELISKAP